MPNYRRAYVPGGSFFFTLVCERRAPLFADAHACRLLGSIFRRAQLRWPFTINALVLLPEHWHAIWSLPPGDTAFSTRWGWIKKEFTRGWLAWGGLEQEVSYAAGANAGEESGNGDSGNTRSNRKTTSSGISTTSISIR